MAISNEPVGMDTSLADATFNETQKQYTDALTDYWNTKIRDSFVQANQTFLYGPQETDDDKRRKAMIAQAKQVGVPSYPENITPDIANLIVQFQTANNPDTYVKERADMKEAERLFGSTLESGEQVREALTYNTYMEKIRDNVIPLEVLTHPLAKALTPNDMDKLKNIVALSNPEFREFQDRGIFVRQVQYNRDSRNDVADMENNVLAPEDYQRRKQIREHIETRDTGFFSKAWGGFANMFQNLVTAGEAVSSGDSNLQKLASRVEEIPTWARPTQNIQGANLVEMIYKASAYDTSRAFADSTAEIAIKTKRPVSEVVAEQVVERSIVNSLGTSLFVFGMLGGAPAAAGTTKLLSKTLTKMGAERAGKFLANKGGAAVGELATGYIGNLAAMQAYQGVSKGAVTSAKNDLLNENASVVGAAIRGLGANLAANAGVTAVFMGPIALSAGRKYLSFRNESNQIDTAVQVAQEGAEISTSEANPVETAELINSTYRQAANTSERIYISANDIVTTLNENQILFDSLTPEQQALFGDLQTKAVNGEDVTLTLGDYSHLFKDDANNLGELLRNHIRKNEFGFSQNEMNQINATLDADLNNLVQEMPELATTEPKQRQEIIAAAQQTISDEIVFDMHNAIADVNVEGLSAQTVTRVAQDVASFVTNLMELCGIPSNQMGAFFKANRPKFAFIRDELNITNEQLGGPNKGTYDAATNTISLRNDSDVVTLMHEVSHYYLETIMTAADTFRDNATLMAIRDDILQRYGLSNSYTGWANVDAATKQRIHEEFVYANIMQRVDKVFKASDEVDLNSNTYKASVYLNRALATSIIKNHFGTIEHEAGNRGPIKQDQINQALALEQKDFTENYGYDTNRFEDSPIFATLNDWANRGVEGHRIAELNPINDTRLDIDVFRGTVPDDVLNAYQSVRDRSNEYIEAQVARDSFLNGSAVYRAYAAVAKRIKQAIANDPSVQYTKEDVARAQVVFDDAQRELDAVLVEREKAIGAHNAKRHDIQELRSTRQAPKETLAQMDADYKAEWAALQELHAKVREARLKTAQAQRDLKAAQHNADNTSKMVQAKIDSFERRAKAAKDEADRITEEVTKEFDDQTSELRSNWDLVEHRRQALQSAPLLRSDLEQMGLTSTQIAQLRRNGLLVDAYVDSLQADISHEVWRSYYQGNIVKGIKELSEHTSRDGTIARVSIERYNLEHSNKEVHDALVHSQMKITSEVLSRELDIVNTALGIPVTHTSEGGVVRTTTISSYISKKYRAAIGNLKYNNSSPQQLVARAQRARNQAIAALKVNDAEHLMQARDLLQRALNLNEMAIEAARIGPRIDKAVSRIRKRFSGEFGENYDKDTLEAAHFILHRVGLSTRKGNRARLDDLRRLNPEAADLLEQVANDNTNTMFYKEMTNGDLLKLIDAVDNILEKSREIKALADEADKAIRAQQATKISARLSTIVKTDKAAAERMAQHEMRAGGPNEQSPTKVMEIQRVARDSRHSSTKVSYLCQRLDGQHTDGPMYTHIYKPMRDAQTQYNKDNIALAERLAPTVDKLQHVDDDIKGKNIRVEFVADDPKAIAAKHLPNQKQTIYLEADMNGGVRRKLVGYMLHMGNNENFDALARSLGMTRESLIKKVHELEESGVITKEMWDICEEIWGAYDGILDKSQDACYRIEGRRFKKAEARTIVSKHGTYKGGYVPISIVNREIKTDTMLDLTSNFNNALPSSSHTKDRTVHYHEIDCTVEASIRGLDEQLRYADILPAANDVYNLVSKTDTEISRLLDAVDPDCAKDVLIPWLINTCRQGGGEASPTIRAVHRWIAGPLNTAVLALDVANAAQQLTGVLVAGLRTSPSALLWSMMPWVTPPIGGRAARDISAMSPYMETRFGMNANNMALLQQRVTTTTTLGGVRNWLNNHAYVLQFYTQRYVDSVVWNASYASEYKKHLAAGATPDEARAASINTADDVVRSTQGSFDIVDASKTENNLWTKIITPFTNYFLTMSNLNATEVGVRTAQHQAAWSIAASKVYVTTLAVIVPTTIGTFIAQGLKGKWYDDDKEMSDFLAEAGPISWFKTFVMGKNPWLGSALSATADMMFGGKYSSNSFLSPPVATTATTFANALDHAYLGAVGERDFTPTDFDSLAKASSLFAAPLPNTLRYLNFFRMMATGEVDTRNLTDLTRGIITGRPSKEQLE